MGIFSFMSKKKPETAPQYQFVNFRVAGVTYKNEDGSDRQTILRHIKFQDPPYVPAGSSDVDVEIKKYSYKGAPAYHCIVNGYIIGSVPADKVQEVADAVKHPDATVTGFQITGGGKYNYGCDIAIRYKK